MHTEERLPLEEAMADRLASAGLLVIDGFLGVDVALRLRADVVALRERGVFRAARIGSGAQRRHAPLVRRDEICWFDVDAGPDADDGAAGVAPPDEVRRFLARVDGLREDLNRLCYLGLVRTECHAACYADGAFYRAHLDTFVGRPARTVSFVYFLNPGWEPEDGGYLRVHGEAPEDIAPVLDRLVLFRSREVLHEVLPVRRERYALTGWLSVREGALPR